MAEVTRESPLKVIDIHVDALVANENNTNQMTDAQLSRLVSEIKDVGMMVPLNVIPLPGGRYLILGGEHRWRASKAAGMIYVPCVVHSDARWTDMDLVDLQTFKLNAIHGQINGQKFFRLYQKMCEKVGAERVQDALAVTDNAEWKKITKNIHQSLKNSGASQEVLEEVKEAEKKAKTPDDLSKALAKIFKKQATAIQSNTIVVQYDQSEYILMKASTDVYIGFKKLILHANESNKDVNELIQPVLDGLVKSFDARQA